MPRLRSIRDVVDWRHCLGCGACAYACDRQQIRLVDFISEGIRPVMENADCGSCRDCLEVCPAVAIDFGQSRLAPSGPDADADVNERIRRHWGPVLEIWEGHAADEDIRFRGSSGGALTALAAYCVEQGGMAGVLHIGQDPEDPVRNRTRLSRTRAELLATTGSRYSPASVGNGLGLVEAAGQPCAIVGQPSEIAAVANARKLRPALDRNIGVTLSFFCAGSPPSSATLKLLERHEVPSAQVRDLRYRGLGWPGHFAPTVAGQASPQTKLTYRESWAFLQAFRPWSVQMWPDGSGELADISCGDPWYTEPDGVNPGSSLIVVRTERGRDVLHAAIASGYLVAARAETWKLEKSQSGLRMKKGSVWGRRLATRLIGLPATRITGTDLFGCWLDLNLNEKLRSTLGTLRRIFQRGYLRRQRPLTGTRVDVRPAAQAAHLVAQPTQPPKAGGAVDPVASQSAAPSATMSVQGG